MNLLAMSSTYSVTAELHDVSQRTDGISAGRYNALTFIISTEDTTKPTSGGRLQKPGLIAPKLEWTVKRKSVAVARLTIVRMADVRCE
jgi:hypothetical protein